VWEGMSWDSETTPIEGPGGREEETSLLNAGGTQTQERQTARNKRGLNVAGADTKTWFWETQQGETADA